MVKSEDIFENKTPKLEGVSQMSKQLFFFILIISGNYLGELFTCGTQRLFQNNMYIKHLLGLMTMYFFVTFFSTIFTTLVLLMILQHYLVTLHI